MIDDLRRDNEHVHQRSPDYPRCNGLLNSESDYASGRDPSAVASTSCLFLKFSNATESRNGSSVMLESKMATADAKLSLLFAVSNESQSF